jgi:aryl-alcohol dehydrogenase-like predicted oxidoreductase
MKTRRLGDSDLEITSIGLGTYALGGAGWKFAWGAQDDRESIAAIRHAITGGINWIDTAPVYGLGHAEEIVARAVEGLTQRPLIFTKCSMTWNDRGEIANVLKRDSIQREVEQSLKRLRVDVIDLYQIHWPRAEDDLEEAWETMVRLKDAGKVRHIGVSNFNTAQLQRVGKIATPTSLQPPYSLLDTAIDAAVLPYTRAHGIGVIAYAPMQSGLLSGKMTRARVAALPKDDWRRGHENFTEPRLSHNLAVANVLTSIARELPAKPRPFTAGEVAIAWVLQRPGITGAIVGARRADQVDEILRADEVVLDAPALAQIEAAVRAPTARI